MKCEVCNVTSADGKTVLIRQNRKGEIGVWRCTSCNRKPIPNDVTFIINAFKPPKAV